MSYTTVEDCTLNGKPIELDPMPSASAPPSHRSVQVSKVDGGLVLNDAASWATPGDRWLIVHDIFHHQPEDDGSFACEAMSFGAQCWIEHDTDELRLGIDPTSLCAILEQVAARDPASVRDTLILSADPPSHPLPESRFLERFRGLVEEAVVESSFAHKFRNVDDATVSVMCDGPNVARIVGWMSYGFHRAQFRFPDPQATRRLFDDLSRALGQWKDNGGEVFAVDIDEAAGTVSARDPAVRQVLVQCGVAGVGFEDEGQVRRRSAVRPR